MSDAAGKSEETVLRSIHPRVAFVFDFDETLGPNTTNALLQHVGVDAEEFREGRVQPLADDGWEQRLAEAHALAELSQGPHGPITHETFEEVAAKLELYPGVPEMFDRVTAAVRDIEDDLEVEFYLVTAGFVHVPAATSIAARFDSIIGGHWAFEDSGQIVTPKSVVGHYDKVRHLLAIAKGLDSVEADRARDVDRHIPEEKWHVPFEQMVFVGDGDSDLPAFDFMESHSGMAIAVRQASADGWESRDAMRDGRQVAALTKSDFSAGSPLMTALEIAARRAALWVSLLRTSPQATDEPNSGLAAECVPHPAGDSGEPGGLVDHVSIRPEHEPVDAMLADQVGQLVHPLIRRAAQEPLRRTVGDHAVDVADAPDVLRATARSPGRLVDDGVLRDQLLYRHPWYRRDPSVGLLAEQPQRPRPVHA